jgi:diamine N-acetyltransferase
MLTLKGEKVYLRALEPDDLDYLYSVENDEEFWEVSSTHAPFSRYVLRQYLENAHRDLYEVKQLRLVICEAGDDSPAGFIDLFDLEPKHNRAAVGILIRNHNSRKKGFGFEALELLCNYCFTHLGLHQIYANVGAENTSSKLLFEKAGFACTARKKDWVRVNGSYKDELIYQLINKDVH